MIPNKIFFTSDSHFLHANKKGSGIIDYANRSFENIDDMNEQIIYNWNNVVPTDGVVYHLGDVALGHPSKALEILNRLNGKIHLLKGNHEKTVLKNSEMRKRFEGIYDYLELKIPDPEPMYTATKSDHEVQLIILCHYPFQSWKNLKFLSWHLHGHCHSNLPTPDHMLRLDVGLDNPFCDFYPASYEKIKEHMKTKNFKAFVDNENL
jgi:calcineurin-like phosphoesterase family protein